MASGQRGKEGLRWLIPTSQNVRVRISAELMEDLAFEKINVADICEKCDMNRKRFYYRFKDKYDLVNRIYGAEFIAAIGKKSIDTGWDFLQNLCGY